MKTFLKIIGLVFLSAAVSAGTLFVLYNYAPLSILSLNQSGSQKLGSTITTIQGSDTISGSRTTINTNFANLNSSKAEISAVSGTTTLSSLANVGTLVTGIWNASTITVPYGGTGSTTLSANQILLGNGAGNVKTPAGWGTSGQLLTSNGTGAAPSWSSPSIDTTIAYNWTGLHSFAATTTMATSTVASTTITTLNTTATSTFVGPIVGVLDYQVFTANGTWTKPAGLTGNELAFVQAWGPGGGGGSCAGGGSTCGSGGGGGGAYVQGYILLSRLTGTVSVTVPTGGAIASNPTGDTSFGSYITAYRGGGSPSGANTGTATGKGGGGGGGTLAAGAIGAGSDVGGAGGSPSDSFGGGAGGGNANGNNSVFGGGGGGGSDSGVGSDATHVGGNSIYGGGGGSAATTGGGSSVFGGVGGAGCTSSACTATVGTAPGGGGGGCSLGTSLSSCTGAAGARGEVRVWVIR